MRIKNNRLVLSRIFLFFLLFTSAVADAGSNQFALALFYMSSCPHCQRFDPILKRYANAAHLPVLAYTLDHQDLPSFPSSLMPSAAEIHAFFPGGNVVVPTVFLIDTHQQKIYPLLQGEASYTELSSRVTQLFKNLSMMDKELEAERTQEQEFHYD